MNVFKQLLAKILPSKIEKPSDDSMKFVSDKSDFYILYLNPRFVNNLKENIWFEVRGRIFKENMSSSQHPSNIFSNGINEPFEIFRSKVKLRERIEFLLNEYKVANGLLEPEEKKLLSRPTCVGNHPVNCEFGNLSKVPFFLAYDDCEIFLEDRKALKDGDEVFLLYLDKLNSEKIIWNYDSFRKRSLFPVNLCEVFKFRDSLNNRKLKIMEERATILAGEKILNELVSN